MKKSYGLLALALLLAAPAMAQNPTIGVYFDAQGHNNTAIVNGGYDETHTAYIVAFFENLVGGAAFQLTVDSRISVLGEVTPPGIEIGTALTGCEIGLTNPAMGFYGQPVLLDTITLWTGANTFANGPLCIGPWVGRYDTVILSDHLGTLTAADGLCGYLTVPVAVESQTWGGVKDMFK